MKATKFPNDSSLYWLAFALALGLRLFQLGAAPLADAEATWALQARGLAHGTAITLGAQPAYILITSQLFSLFGDTNFIARLYPALAGSLLVWLPWAFRRWTHGSGWLKRAGFVLAFGLAIDPGLVSLSRQAGSSLPAVAFTFLALAALYNRRMVWVGILAGLALLSGPAFIQGVLVLAIAWGLVRLVVWKPAGPEPGAAENDIPAESAPGLSITKAIPSFVLTLLVAGTLFLRAPQGLGGLADSLSAYLRMWVNPSGVPVLRLPAALLLYQTFVIIFALAAFVHAWLAHQDEQEVRPVLLGLGLLAVVAIILPLFALGRQVGDMAWALVPLWTLAAIELARLWPDPVDRITTLAGVGLAVLLFVLVVGSWLNLLAIVRFQAEVGLYWARVIVALMLGLIAALLVVAGWSLNAAKTGIVISLCIVFGLQFAANSVGMSIVRQNGAQELWAPSPTTGQAGSLLTSLADLSAWNTGLRDQLEIVVLNGPPSLEWALRHFPNMHLETALSPTSSPPVVITVKGAQEPSLAEKYRGQDFAWSLSPGWQGALPPNFMDWLTFRAAPLNQGQVILWARDDIFPGGTPQSTGNAVP